MCVIAAKGAGIDMPTSEEIKNMWFRNSDGAGIMLADGNNVRIEKGFMELSKFEQRLKELDRQFDLKKRSVVMHFRITTHGGTIPENTHPFPISDSVGMLRKLKLKTDLGVAHNGIIRVTPRKGISDTMEYIAGQLAPLKKAMPRFYTNDNLLQMIENATESKLAFLDRKGKIVTVGKFIEHNGVLYSNDSYEKYTYFRNTRWDEWDDDRWNDNYSGNIYRTVNLMWLDEDQGQFVLNAETCAIVPGEFAIDSAGNLYTYSYSLDCMREVHNINWQAYDGDGKPLVYDTKSIMICQELVRE